MLITKDNMMSTFLKKDDDKLVNYGDLFPLVLAIDGDAADDFAGVVGVSKGTIYKELEEIYYMIGSCTMDDIYRRMETVDGRVFVNEPRKNKKSVWNIYNSNDIVEKNIRLCSFELLSRHLNDACITSVLEKNKEIKKIIHESADIKIKQWQHLSIALNNMTNDSINIGEGVIRNLFKDEYTE